MFDQAMDDTIAGLDSVLHIRDDFIVFGKDNAHHDRALENVLQRFQECGLTFKPKKCKFRLPQIEFFGFVFSARASHQCMPRRKPGNIVKAKQLLRSKMGFPGINKRMERRIASCIPCQANINTSQRDPLKMSPTPDGPWLEASAVFFGPFPTEKIVLVVLDAYSKYSEVEIVSSTAARNALPALEQIFASHGIPEVLKTDNGPPPLFKARHSMQRKKLSTTEE